MEIEDTIRADNFGGGHVSKGDETKTSTKTDRVLDLLR